MTRMRAVRNYDPSVPTLLTPQQRETGACVGGCIKDKIICHSFGYSILISNNEIWCVNWIILRSGSNHYELDSVTNQILA
jgi:hypothetical protein